MRPSELSSALAALIPTRQPLFLWGPPGVGKSSLIRQTAALFGIEIADVRAVLLDPVDLRGLPRINGDNRAHWCPPEFLPHDKDSKGVLFLDELPQAAPLVQSACLQLTLDRSIGEYRLPEGWAVIAAGNRTEDRAGTHRLISPLLNRFVHLDIDVSHDDWMAWAIDNGIESVVRAFLNFRPDLLFRFDPSSGDRSFPTPRSWEFVSRILHHTPENCQHAVIAGCIGQGPSAEFVGFLRLYEKLPDLDEVLANPTTYHVPSEPDVTYALCGALTNRVNSDPSALKKVVKYGSRFKPEFATVLMRDFMRQCPVQLNACQEFKQWLGNHREMLLD